MSILLSFSELFGLLWDRAADAVETEVRFCISCEAALVETDEEFAPDCEECARMHFLTTDPHGLTITEP